jgi:hypothetical protein
MSSIEPHPVTPPARPGWIDRFLTFLRTGTPEEPVAVEPVPADRRSVVEPSPAGDVYRL